MARRNYGVAQREEISISEMALSKKTPTKSYENDINGAERI
jgi:hypothetical protein